MEVINGDLKNHSDVILNGYMNKSFQTLHKEKNSDNMAICELDPCEVSGVSTQLQTEDSSHRYEKKAKGTRIWSFVSRRRANSGRTKRPQSMILTTEINEPKPKLSFMDKVRSFKRLRSATFSKSSVLRSSKAKVQSEPQENIELSIPTALFRMRKYGDGQRPYRHSYAGYIDDLDTSFEDVELNISISECTASESKWLGGIGVGINGNSEHIDNESISSNRRRPLVNTKSSTISEGEIQRRGLKIPLEHRRGRSSYMWSYLKGISLATKDNSKGLDKIQGTTFQNIECTTDNKPPHETDPKFEDSVDMAKISDTASGGKSKNFSGVFKFFNNVAEAARKWRGSSRSASDDQVSQSTPRTPRLQNSSGIEPLIIENENALSFPSALLQSPVSGVWKTDVQHNLSVRDISANVGTEEELCKPTNEFTQTAENAVYFDKTCCMNDELKNSVQAAFSLSQVEEYKCIHGSNKASDTSSTCCQKELLNEPQLHTGFERNAENSFLTQSSVQDEDVFECSESHFSLSSTASSCEEERWHSGILDISREEELTMNEFEGTTLTDQVQIDSNLQTAYEKEEKSASTKHDINANNGLDNDPSLTSDSDTDQKNEESNKFRTSSFITKDESILPPLRLPPTPLTVPPSFKFPLDRCMSLPLSQSTPTGLDQVGWMKRKQMSTGEEDLGSKTLEVRRDSRKGRRWKPINPESHQLPVHQLSSTAFALGGEEMW